MSRQDDERVAILLLLLVLFWRPPGTSDVAFQITQPGFENLPVE